MSDPESNPDLYTLSVWVLHSPYADGSWRGLEKCVTDSSDVPRLFGSRQEAEVFVSTHELLGFKPVRVLLTVPAVRRDTSVVPPDVWSSVDGVEEENHG